MFCRAEDGQAPFWMDVMPVGSGLAQGTINVPCKKNVSKVWHFYAIFVIIPQRRGTADAELKPVPSAENLVPLLKVSYDIPRKSQNIAFYASPTARKSASLISAFHVHSTSFSSQSLSSIKLICVMNSGPDFFFYI